MRWPAPSVVPTWPFPSTGWMRCWTGRPSGSGCPATVRPIEEVGRFLTGGRPVTFVRPVSTKRITVDVVVPVPDMSALGEPTGDLTGAAAGEPPRSSIWPHVEENIVDLVLAHHSTIIFANSRRLAERLTARLNEILRRPAGRGRGPDRRASGAGGSTSDRATGAGDGAVRSQLGRSRGAGPVPTTDRSPANSGH